MRFRIIKDCERTGFVNMAIDDYFFEKCERKELDDCVIRIFRWNPPALSIGYHQKYERVLDEEYLKQMGFDVVRRPTGGKAVLHDKELTYSVVGSLSKGYFEGDSLDQTYHKISLALKKGLEILGLEPELEKRSNKIDVHNPSPCFLIPTQKEILIEGKKIIGSAQKRGLNAFVQHGSIPIQLDYEVLAKSTRNSEKDIPIFKESFADLRSFLPSLTKEELESALVSGFKEEFKGEFYEVPLNDEELKQIEKIATNKYSTEMWNKKKQESL